MGAFWGQETVLLGALRLKIVLAALGSLVIGIGAQYIIDVKVAMLII